MTLTNLNYLSVVEILGTFDTVTFLIVFLSLIAFSLIKSLYILCDYGIFFNIADEFHREQYSIKSVLL